MPSIDYHTLRRSVPLKDYLDAIGYPFTLICQGLARGPCPTETGDDPRCCSIDLMTQVWKCHNCQRAGTVLDWHMARTALPILQAALDLCSLMKIDVPYLPRSHLRSPRERRSSEKEVANEGEDEVE